MVFGGLQVWLFGSTQSIFNLALPLIGVVPKALEEFWAQEQPTP